MARLTPESVSPDQLGGIDEAPAFDHGREHADTGQDSSVERHDTDS